MVRETRHLWVGNLPDNVTKERIKEYFNRFGPVKSVNPLPGKDGETPAHQVAFMDIKSACKALQTTHSMDARTLKTDFYDPASGACGSGSVPPAPEEKGGGPGGGPPGPGQQAGKLEHGRTGNFYRGHGAESREYGARGPAGGRYQDNQEYRHRSRPPYRNGGAFNQDGGRGSAASYRNSYGWKDARGGRAEPGAQYPGPGSEKAEPAGGRLPPGGKGQGPAGQGSTSAAPSTPTSGKGKKQRTRKSKSSESGSDSQQSGSNSRSSSSSSSRSSSSNSGSSKSPSPDRSGRLGKRAGLGNAPSNYLPHTEFDKQCTVVVRNLPERPAEGLVKEELAREYKKGGCVIRDVRVVEKKSQSGSSRTAVITFSDPADVSKALEDSRNKRILGSLIDVEKLNSHSDERPRNGEHSEFDPKATRTLFVGNISREVLPSEVHDRFKEFGEILEIDIKKPDYALVQFVDIKSVVRAMRGMGNQSIAGQRVNLGFGLSVATKCVWCDGVGAEVTEKMLQVEFGQYGKIQDLIIDRTRGHALVYFDQLKKATIAVKEMRGRTVVGCRLQTDYASHECRAAFFEHCKKTGMDIRERAKPWEQEQEPSDKRGERPERRPRERSTESRGSGAGRPGGRKRDEYDEELRRFQNERGKFDETERCFTPPSYGTTARRGAASTGGPSRSPSPLASARSSARSPGQVSRTGHDRSAFSDRESVVSDGSRHGSPVSRESWRGPRYKPRVQAISPPGDSHSPADHDDSRRGSKRYREEEPRPGRAARTGALPQDPRVELGEKKHFKPLGVDSGLSEETSSGSSGSVPDVDSAKLPSGRASSTKASRRTSTDSASASMDGSSRPTTPGLAAIPVYTSASLLRVATQEDAYTAPRTPVSPGPASSDGSRPGTPLCDENPENLMSRPAAAPVRLASHLRTQNNGSEPMSLPLPRFAHHVLSTSPGDRSARPLQISPRDSRPEAGAGPPVPASTGALLKLPRPDLAKLSIMSPTKYPPGMAEPRARDPRLKSPTGGPSPGLPAPALKSPVSVPGGSKPATFLSPGSSTPTTPVPTSGPVLQPKDPRPGAGLLAVAVPAVTTASPLSPAPSRARPTVDSEQPPPAGPEPKAASDSDDLTKRLQLLDKKFESWDSLTRQPGSRLSRQEQGSRFNLDIKPAQPSAIVQKLLSRKSVFDEDSKRLENINEKYEAPGEESAEPAPVGPAAFTALTSLALKPAVQSPSPSASSPLSSAEGSISSLPPPHPSSPVKVSALHHRPNMSPRMYLPQGQSPKALEESSRPLPLPYRAGTPATLGTNPIKPLVDKLSKPAAFTKPSATVTPTLKSTGLTASTSVRSNVFTTTSTKTVSTCTMAPGTLPHPHIGVEKGEASSTTCSPKPDSALTEVTSSLASLPSQETDSDPNVTSTTGTEHKKKQEANRDIRTMKKELDSLTSLKEKRDMGEELLFAPSATIMQAKSKYDKKDKKSTSTTHDMLKDVKRAKESLHKDKIKSNREKKDKMKVKQKNDLKDFLSATATIRKEAKREKEEKRDQDKKAEPKTEDKPLQQQKRRLSSNSEIEEAAEPKSKIPKLKSESEFEPEVKKIKTEPMTPMGRIPKLAKKEDPREPRKEDRKERTDSVSSVRADGSKDRSKPSYSKSDSKLKSRHDDRHAHRLPSSGDKPDDRKRDKHKKKKKEKDKERDKDDKAKKHDKHDKSKSRSHSTDDERHHKKMKKSKDSKKKDDRERPSSKSDKKDKIKRSEDKEKERAREKNMSKEDREKEKLQRRHMEEQRKMMKMFEKKKRMEQGLHNTEADDSSDDETNFSIFDEPAFDPNDPIYFSMYDKVKARRSCVKAKEDEEARKQEEALNKFAKLKAQRLKREGKKRSVDSDDDSLDEDEGHLRISSPMNSEDGAEGSLQKKNSSLLNSSSDSEDGMNGQIKREKKPKSGNTSNDERKRSLKPKRAVVDSSDDESPSGSRKPHGKPHPGLDSSETDDQHDDDKKADAKPKKLHIYTDSESDPEADKKPETKSLFSGNESETQQSKTSALAILGLMVKKKETVKLEVKSELVSSEGEADANAVRPLFPDRAEELVIKKEIKTEDGAEQKLQKKKIHVKKEKKRDKETKEVSKEKSLLGQKLKMAKIFGTSSEDEGNSRNSKPPTPNTSAGKTSASKVIPKIKGQKLRVEQVYSDSDLEKGLDSPALMSSDDDDLPDRPPTPSFPTDKLAVAKPTSPPKPKEVAGAQPEEVVTEEPSVKPTGPALSSEDEMLPQYERNRRLSAHDRQKESEFLFDKLLTVNVDLPTKAPSWKSPGGSLKSPSTKSPGKGVVSPETGSHRSPLISPGGKPTYLLAHFGGDRSARDAEKIHRAQEREMHKKGSDRITKETFKTKKDLEDSSTPKKQDEAKPTKSVEESVAEEKVEQKSLVQVKEKKLDCSKDPKLGQDIEQTKKKSEVKYKDKERAGPLSASSSSPKEDVEKEAKVKSNDLLVKPQQAREEAKHRSKTRPEETTTDRKVREKAKEEKKAPEVVETKAKGKEAPVRSSPVGRGKDEEQSKSGKKAIEVVAIVPKHSAEKIVLATSDSVFDFKDEVEVVELPREKMKPLTDAAKSKLAKATEKSAAAEVVANSAKLVEADYASFAAQTRLEATSSPGPVSEDDDAPLVIATIDNDVTEIPQVEKELPVIVPASANEEENTGEERLQNKSAASSNTKQLKSSESSEQEQLEKSIASITNNVRPDITESADAAVVPPTVEQKRAVISQEETENAISALLGESFDSFEPEPEPEDAPAARPGENLETTGDDEAAAAVAGLADDEAASAVLGLATDMAPGQDWTRSQAKQPEDESIENIAAEIRRSSTESARSQSSETKDSQEEKPSAEKLEKPRARVVAPKKPTIAPEPSQDKAAQDKPVPTAATSAAAKPKVAEEKEGSRLGRKLFLQTQEKQGEQKAHDVFDFNDEEKPVEPLKTIERPKPSSASFVDSVIEEVVKKNRSEEPPAAAPVAARVGAPRDRVAKPAPAPLSLAVATSLPPAQAAAGPAPASPAQQPAGTESPPALQRPSTEGASPPLPLASPTSSKSPKPRMRRSTGGKSRESEEESPDTLQKINLILEQAKQEAERSAHSQAQHLVPLAAFRGAEGQPGPVLAQDILIDPKTGQVVGRQPSAPNSVTLTLVSSNPAEHGHPPHPSDLRLVVPRTGVPQPTVLPPRHEQQVLRPGQPNLPRVVVAPGPVRQVVARPPLPIQLPTQPLPPESVRKAQPVLLEQNQPSKLARTPLPISLPTEPVPRSVVAASQMPSLPRTPLPFSSAALVATQQLQQPRPAITQPGVSRAQVTPVWQAGPHMAARPQNSVAETGQRVSLNKRDKEPELEAKASAVSEATQPLPLKVRGDYLQPREREPLRPASTPLSTPQPLVTSQQYEVPPNHLSLSAAQQAQYDAELVRIANYRDAIYLQLLQAGRPEPVALSMATQMVREQCESYRPVHEEPRPGSVPPSMAMHHMEELRRQQAAQRQPLPAHSSQVDPYRQADSPHGPVYLGQHPYSAHPTHLESYRRPGVGGPEPPAAHSGQPVARLTQSPAVSDYSISRPASPAYNPSVSDYRLPHLAAYPICWSGAIGLKNDLANVRMHYVSGNRDLAKASLPETGSTLKIGQRMRLEENQLEGVARKMETKSEHCMLLALPNGSEHEEIELQSKILRSNFITYLQLKAAAGIVNVSNEDGTPAYIVHVFPSCDFANENLARIAPNLLHRVADIEHLVIVIATVFDVTR